MGLAGRVSYTAIMGYSLTPWLYGIKWNVWPSQQSLYRMSKSFCI